jgi:hypothetical protein
VATADWLRHAGRITAEIAHAGSMYVSAAGALWGSETTSTIISLPPLRQGADDGASFFEQQVMRSASTGSCWRVRRLSRGVLIHFDPGLARQQGAVRGTRFSLDAGVPDIDGHSTGGP